MTQALESAGELACRGVAQREFARVGGLDARAAGPGARAAPQVSAGAGRELRAPPRAAWAVAYIYSIYAVAPHPSPPHTPHRGGWR